MIKIVTLNTWGTSGPVDQRWQLLIDDLKSVSPDLAFLQEVFDRRLIDLIKQVPAVPFETWCHEGGLAFLSKAPAMESRIYRYQTKSMLEDYVRWATLVKTQIKGRQMLAINTHLSWKPEDENSRLGQVEELLELVKGVDMPIIMAGDFNDVPESAPIEEIKKAGFIDLYDLLNPGKAGLTWDNRNPFMKSHSVVLPDRRIDFFFVSRTFLSAFPPVSCDIVFNKANTEGLYPSDHYGLCAAFGPVNPPFGK